MKKILFVDDDRDFVETITFRLKESGYEVIAAYDGQEGLDKAKNEKPDLIVLDIVMPKMDGYAALKILKNQEETKNMPVIILTGKKKMKDIFGVEGIKDYIVKPFEFDDLLLKIKKVFE